jgi:uncharacterized membrane protein YbaN (DUF454 family)
LDAHYKLQFSVRFHLLRDVHCKWPSDVSSSNLVCDMLFYDCFCISVVKKIALRMLSICLFAPVSRTPSWFSAEAQMLFHRTSDVFSSWLILLYIFFACVHSMTQNKVDRKMKISLWLHMHTVYIFLRHTVGSSLLYAAGLRYFLCKWPFLRCESLLSFSDSIVLYALWDGWAGVSYPWKPRYLFLPLCPDRLWGPPSLVSSGNRGLFMWVKWQEPVANWLISI